MKSYRYVNNESKKENETESLLNKEEDIYRAKNKMKPMTSLELTGFCRKI